MDAAGQRFAFRWVLLSGVGLAAGLAVGLGIAGPVEMIVGMMLVTPVTLAVVGSLFGGVQWLAIGGNLRAGALWAAASAAGLGIGMTVGVVAVEVIGRAVTGEQVRLVAVGLGGRFLGLALIGALAGFGVGAVQRLALRGHLDLGWSWVLRCAAGFGIGLSVGGVAAELAGGLQSLGGVAGFLGLAGLIVGAATVGAARSVAARVTTRQPV